MKKLPMRRGVAGLTAAVAAAACVAGLAACAGRYLPAGDGEPPAAVPGVRAELTRHVRALSEGVGERNLYRRDAMERSAAYIERELRAMGYAVRRQPVPVPARPEFALAGPTVAYNLEAVKPGTAPDAKVVVVGAHYDTRVGMSDWGAHGPPEPAKAGTPGANDNASGVAALLEAARRLRDTPTAHEIRFVAYANEEPPFYRTESMGSRVHARALVAEVGVARVVGMISLETLGVYSPRPNKKRDAAVAAGAVGLPDRCDYVAFLSNGTGRSFASRCAAIFTRNARFEVRQVTLPHVCQAVSWSDDWSYMKSGIPSFAATDTAFLRCDDYHETSDTWEKLDYAPFSEVTLGLIAVIREIAGGVAGK